MSVQPRGHIRCLLTFQGDQAVATLIEEVRTHMSIMFKICEAIALLDMVSDSTKLKMAAGTNDTKMASFAHLVTVNDYSRSLQGFLEEGPVC